MQYLQHFIISLLLASYSICCIAFFLFEFWDRYQEKTEISPTTTKGEIIYALKASIIPALIWPRQYFRKPDIKDED